MSGVTCPLYLLEPLHALRGLVPGRLSLSPERLLSPAPIARVCLLMSFPQSWIYTNGAGPSSLNTNHGDHALCLSISFHSPTLVVAETSQGSQRGSLWSAAGPAHTAGP